MRGTKNTWKIAVVSIIVAGIIIFSGYAYGSYKENKFLAEDGSEPTKQEQQTPNEEEKQPQVNFADHRENATLAEYLAYVHQENQSVAISAITNMGDSRQWMKEALTQVAGQIDMDKSRLNYHELQNDRVNSQQLIENTDWDALANEKAALTLIAFPNTADYRDGISVEDSIENAQEIYRNVRIANPETQVVFLTLPGESETFNSDQTYRDGVQQFNDAMKEAKINTLDFVNGDGVLIDQSFEKYDDEGLTPDSYEHLMDAFVKQVGKQKFDLTLGFKGNNDEEIEQLKQQAEEAQAEAEQEAAEQQAAEQAARQQAAEEEAARQREAEQAAEAEAARQREEEAAQQQQAQEEAQNAQPDPNAQGTPNEGTSDVSGGGQAGTPDQAPAAGNGQGTAGTNGQ
ncbi:MAG: hypothetical protein MR008_03805 [Aerococcus sp.]|nr:hypothetical protein [Aerococcus sp.]